MAVQRTVGGRVPRAMGPEHYQTFRILQRSDQTVKASCETAGCPYWTTGWDTIIDESSDLGAAQARWIRTPGGADRTFRELRTDEGLTVFRFEAHQRCFQDHETLPEVFAVVGGDWRGNPRGTRPRIHQRPDDWVEDFALTVESVVDQQAKG